MKNSCKFRGPIRDQPMRYSKTLLLLLIIFAVSTSALAQHELSITRPARPWEFLPAVGEKAAILGHESGEVEAWVYPMKLFRDFSLVFYSGGKKLPADSLVRTINVHPESVTLTYAEDTFSVRETFFVPRGEMGAVIALEISTYQPIKIEARFRRDFQLMWPAAVGATYENWNEQLKAFTFGEETKKWFGIVGSPEAHDQRGEHETNYDINTVSSFRLGPFQKGTHRQLIAIAGSVTTQADAESTYKKLLAQYDSLLKSSAQQYAEYLLRTTSLSLPDRDLQDAYDWSRVSEWQGLVTNPFMGTGLVAGYRTSGTSARPGFAWFFGRDSEWTSFALNSSGDFETTKTALEFIRKFQRQDGKIPHEISQAAKQVPWFTDYPYPWAAADATPLYIIAVRDYYLHSGDAEFVNTHWDNVWRAYEFLRSTWDERGLPKNNGVGHGWVEGGPLLPVKTEFYQSGLGAEALNSLAILARAAGKNDVAAEAAKLYDERRELLNGAFWSPQGKFFAFALNQQDQRVDTPTVLTTAPMWFGTPDAQKSDATLTVLANGDHMADWGMRIISDRDKLFDPAGYHFGSVWPLFTGWASVGAYRYHRGYLGYESLKANAMLASTGSAGHPTEVLSGAVFQSLSTSSPHQIWSAAMVVSPMLRGLLGLDADAANKTLTVAPHTPADWTWWKARNVRFGSGAADVSYRNEGGTMSLEVASKATGTILVFSPALSPRARVNSVSVNGRAAKFDIQQNRTDQHVVVRVPLSSATTAITIRTQGDFGLALSPKVPELGAMSSNLRVVDETWTSDSVTYVFAGPAGKTYDVGFRGGPVAKVEGAELLKERTFRVQFPSGANGYVHARVTVHFGR